MTTCVVIPWRAGCPHRERNLEWVRDLWEFPTVLGEAPDGSWCKAAAVADGLTKTDADVLVVADADVHIAPDAARIAVDALDSYGWAIPHRTVHRLTEDATDALVAGEPTGQLEQEPYTGWPGGGIVILPRSTYEDVPLDRRFHGWGQEDESWAFALRCLAGPAFRGDAPLTHLWHPPQERRNRTIGSQESKQLRDLYRRARSNPARMRALVDESKEVRWESNASSSTT